MGTNSNAWLNFMSLAKICTYPINTKVPKNTLAMNSALFSNIIFPKKNYLTIINQTFFLPNNLQDRFLSIFQPVLQYSQLNRSMKNWGQFFEIARILEIEIFE